MKKVESIFVVLGLTLSLWMIILVVEGYNNSEMLRIKGVATKGFIYKTDRRGKNPKLHYIFYVDGQQYQGNGYFLGRKDTLSFGDSIDVKYDRNNPKNSQPTRQLKKGLKKIRF